MCNFAAVSLENPRGSHNLQCDLCLVPLRLARAEHHLITQSEERKQPKLWLTLRPSEHSLLERLLLFCAALLHIVLSLSPDNRLFRLLCYRPIAYLGRISYMMYLLHSTCIMASVKYLSELRQFWILSEKMIPIESTVFGCKGLHLSIYCIRKCPY